MDHKKIVPFKCSQVRNSITAERFSPKILTSCTQSSERTEPVLIPLTHHYIGGFSFSSGHSFATCTHRCEEHLHTVDTVPEKIGMGLLNRGRAIRICTQHLPDHLIMTYCLYGGYISRSEEHTSELQSRGHLVCRLLLETQK